MRVQFYFCYGWGTGKEGFRRCHGLSFPRSSHPVQLPLLTRYLQVLKRAVFESRAARELYGLEDSMSSPRKAMQDNKPPHSITRTRLNSMAQKIKQCRRTMCTLDQSVSHVSSEVLFSVSPCAAMLVCLHLASTD